MLVHRTEKILVRSTSVGLYLIIFPLANRVDPLTSLKSCLISSFSVCKNVKRRLYEDKGFLKRWGKEIVSSFGDKFDNTV